MGRPLFRVRFWGTYYDVTVDEPLGVVFATASDFGNTGNELYVTNGTLSGSIWSRTSTPAVAISNPHGLTVADDGTLYFAADDGVDGDALWKSDGTAAGTTLVKIINPNFTPVFFDGTTKNLSGLGSSSDAFYQVHGRIYFTVEDDGSGTSLSNLWTSDGTTAGTYSLGVPLTGPTDAGSVATDGDNLFFDSNDELWETDGTIAGTHQVTSGTTETGTNAFALYLGLAPTPEVSKPPSESPIVLDNFGWAQGWGSPDNPRVTADVDGNGTTDYVGFGADSVFINYGGTFANGQGTGPGFTDATFAVHDFGTAEGYTTSVQRGVATTQAGSGATIYGQGFAGVFWYGATGGHSKPTRPERHTRRCNMAAARTSTAISAASRDGRRATGSRSSRRSRAIPSHRSSALALTGSWSDRKPLHRVRPRQVPM